MSPYTISLHCLYLYKVYESGGKCYFVFNEINLLEKEIISQLRPSLKEAKPNMMIYGIIPTSTKDTNNTTHTISSEFQKKKNIIFNNFSTYVHKPTCGPNRNRTQVLRGCPDRNRNYGGCPAATNRGLIARFLCDFGLDLPIASNDCCTMEEVATNTYLNVFGVYIAIFWGFSKRTKK